jgi:hypothetical protein
MHVSPGVTMRIPMVGAALLTLAGAGVAIGIVPAASTAGPSVAQLSWMAGCLELRSGDRVVEEQRMGVRGGSMLGMARTTGDKGLVEYELTLIHERAGKIIFEAWPSGQPAGVFTATSAGTDSAVFAAPEHDFPQIVGYRRSGADSVVAWISGISGGKVQRIEFPYRRVPCLGAVTR